MIKWGCLLPFPNDDTFAFWLLSVTAICGELPSDALALSCHSLKYTRQVIYHLIKTGYMRVYYQDKIRGYRLTAKSKTALLEKYPHRYSAFLTGCVETNQIKNTPTRRCRLHSLAEVYLMMTAGGASVFPDEKPAVFSGDSNRSQLINSAIFYSSREMKRLDKEDTIKLSGSRMAGLLLTPKNVYITYNSRKELLDLDYRYEQRCHTLLTESLCSKLLYKQYKPEHICGLMFANDHSILRDILQSASTNQRNYFLLDGDYDHFYYLTTDHHGITLLKLMCDPKIQNSLDKVLRQDLSFPKKKVQFDCDGIDRNGAPVLFGYFMDIPRISRFCTHLWRHKTKGVIICFDFQRDVLASFVENKAIIQAISFDKFERSFFPSENANS